MQPPYRSEWGRRFVDTRITQFDGIRPFVSRAALLGILLVLLLALPSAGPVAIVLLVPAAVQVVLELALEAVVRAKSAEQAMAGHQRVAKVFVAPWYANYEKGLTNVTGVLGGFACTLNLVAVVYVTGTGEDWRRVAALAVALLYLVSGANGVVTDAAVYSLRGKRVPPVLRRALPFAWLAVLVIVVANVATAQWWLDVWEGSLPYALIATALVYGIGLRMRDHTRDMYVGARTAAALISESNMSAGRDLHNLFQIAKGPLEEAQNTLGLDTEAGRRIHVFRLDMESIYRAARAGETDLTGGLMPPVSEHLRRITRSAMIPLETDIGLDGVARDDEYLAKQALILLTENAVDAYQRAGVEAGPRRIRAAAGVDGASVRVSVADGCPPLDDATWSRTDTSLAGLRDDVVRRGGRLRQELDGDGKVILAEWTFEPPPLRDEETPQ